MQQQFQQLWQELQDSVSLPERESALWLCTYLAIGGVLALYLRFLYDRCSASASDSSSFTRIFPLLTLVTTAVIAVVKSSLALSLGLVGALSIVRFRAAIKEPEELVYLFMCIALGLCLGAEKPLLAVSLVGVASVFVVGMHLMGTDRRRSSLMLTVTGDSAKYFGESEPNVLTAVEKVADRYSIHRLDIENGRGQLRVVLRRSKSSQMGAIITRLREELPECEFSYLNMDSTL